VFAEAPSVNIICFAINSSVHRVLRISRVILVFANMQKLLFACCSLPRVG